MVGGRKRKFKEDLCDHFKDTPRLMLVLSSHDMFGCQQSPAEHNPRTHQGNVKEASVVRLSALLTFFAVTFHSCFFANTETIMKLGRKDTRLRSILAASRSNNVDCTVLFRQRAPCHTDTRTNGRESRVYVCTDEEKQARIHGQYQSRTGGQGRKCAFSHFQTRSPRTDGQTDGQSLL